jgi:hypothetical protein
MSRFEATMIIICAWCGKAMGEKEPLEDTRVTHSICPSCQKQVEETFGRGPQTRPEAERNFPK